MHNAGWRELVPIQQGDFLCTALKTIGLENLADSVGKLVALKRRLKGGSDS
jgi:hypothetical protein